MKHKNPYTPIRAILRRAWLWYDPARKTLLKIKLIQQKPKSWECAICSELTNKPQVDHIVPCGQLKNNSDLPGFVKRLFCEIDGLQILCKECHDNKTYDRQ